MLCYAVLCFESNAQTREKGTRTRERETLSRLVTHKRKRKREIETLSRLVVSRLVSSDKQERAFHRLSFVCVSKAIPINIRDHFPEAMGNKTSQRRSESKGESQSAENLNDWTEGGKAANDLKFKLFRSKSADDLNRVNNNAVTTGNNVLQPSVDDGSDDVKTSLPKKTGRVGWVVLPVFQRFGVLCPLTLSLAPNPYPYHPSLYPDPHPDPNPDPKPALVSSPERKEHKERRSIVDRPVSSLSIDFSFHCSSKSCACLVLS